MSAAFLTMTSAHTGRIERVGSPVRVYFIAPDETRWRVYDRVYERMVGWHAFTPPIDGADHRVLVPQSGVKHVFQFRAIQPRDLTPELLELQLSAAENMISERADSMSRNPW